MKSISKVIILMAIVVLLTYGGASALKLFGINGGYPIILALLPILIGVAMDKSFILTR